MGIAIDTLAYARRLREAGYSEQQAEAHAEALAAAMTDTLATKQDLRELEMRMDARFIQVDARFAQIDARFEYLEKHIDVRLAEQEKRLDNRLVEQEKRTELRFAELSADVRAQLADLERRMTMRLGAVTVAALGILSALDKLI